MKIAYITPRFHPFKGGAEQNLLALSTRVAKLGFDSTVLTTNARFNNEKLIKEEFYKGLRIIRHWAPTEALYAGFYPQLLPHLLLNNYDIIHSSGIGFFWREFCLILKKLTSGKNTRFIVTPHGPFLAATSDKGFRAIIRKIGNRILRIYINWLYDEFIAVNPKQHVWMEALYKINPVKIINIPNGIDEAYIAPHLIEHKPDDKVVITYMNRMEEYKGIQQVLKAINKILEIPAANKNFIFYIMGRPGGYTKTLESMVRDMQLESHTKFIFSPEDKERDEIFYKESQINILPSQWEATGITLLEAMAKGNIIITTEQNEAADILIKEGENGFIYSYDEIDKLVEGLSWLLKTPELRERMRKESLEMSSKFTWESVVKIYVDLLNNIKYK
ncbi:MAG: glycosyltransferase family 4 protein [Candidatus Dojkabacteria bacterium]